MKVYSYKETILFILNAPQASKKYTCAQICKEMAFYDRVNTTKQLNASVSSILKKMVDDGELQYSTEKGPRGGAIYEINQNNKLAGGYGKECSHSHRHYLFE